MSKQPTVIEDIIDYVTRWAICSKIATLRFRTWAFIRVQVWQLSTLMYKRYSETIEECLFSIYDDSNSTQRPQRAYSCGESYVSKGQIDVIKVVTIGHQVLLLKKIFKSHLDYVPILPGSLVLIFCQEKAVRGKV